MMATVHQNTEIVKRIARELQFDGVGIADPGSLKEGEEAILRWVSEGKHGEMKYLEDLPKRRQKFFQEFKELKSVIVLGVNYFSGNPVSKSDPGISGKVARYAWGRDYHEVIAARHRVFMERLKQEFGKNCQAKSCVDIQPLPERFAASRAGLGFIGKHTGILNERFGPWLFLSEILTNLELAEDVPSQGDCGTCDHCQTRCPTGALNQNYELDARLCIAYWTIEHKGVIPREIRPLMKDWIFGCDECLEVCPFTSKSKETGWDALKPESGVGPQISIGDLFEIKSNAQYQKRFQHTALLRANRKQMLRNACIVLGNSGSKQTVGYLEKAMADPAPLVRIHAAWALSRLNFSQARAILSKHRGIEANVDVLAEIDWALRQKTAETK